VSVSALRCASVGCTANPAVSARPNSAGTSDIRWRRTKPRRAGYHAGRDQGRSGDGESNGRSSISRFLHHLSLRFKKKSTGRRAKPARCRGRPKGLAKAAAETSSEARPFRGTHQAWMPGSKLFIAVPLPSAKASSVTIERPSDGALLQPTARKGVIEDRKALQLS